MSNFFIEKNNCSSPSLWHTDTSYSALATIHFPNTSSILVIIRSAHWMLAAINLSVRGASLRPSEQIVCRLHVQTGENRSHDADDPFAALVHPGIIYFCFVFAKASIRPMFAFLLTADLR